MSVNASITSGSFRLRFLNLPSFCWIGPTRQHWQFPYLWQVQRYTYGQRPIYHFKNILTCKDATRCYLLDSKTNPLNFRIILSPCPLNSRRCCLSGHLRTLWWLPLISYSFWEINGGHYLDTHCCFIKPTANFLPMPSTLFASFRERTCSYFLIHDINLM